MGDPRTFRFAIAPFVLAFWIVASFLFQHGDTQPLTVFVGWKPVDVGAVVTALVAASLPVGFLVSSATVLVLRVCWALQGSHYEGTNLAGPICEVDERMFRTAIVGRIHSAEALSAWIDRRWTAFMTWANIVTATALGIFVAPKLHQDFRIGDWWHCVAWSALVACTINAWRARRESMGMLRFIARTRPTWINTSWVIATSPIRHD